MNWPTIVDWVLTGTDATRPGPSVMQRSRKVVSDLEYREYLKSVSGKLEADDYQIETGVIIPRYKVDIYAFKDMERSAIASTHIQIACFFTQASEAAGDIVEDFCRSALTYENDRRGRIVNIMSYQGEQPTRLILPVVAAGHVTKDGIAFVRSYNPFSWQLYQHPVLVNLETGEVFHRSESMLYGAAYLRMLNSVVEERITPR